MPRFLHCIICLEMTLQAQCARLTDYGQMASMEVAEATPAPLSGLWVLKYGSVLSANTFFDVVGQPGGKEYSAFPISGCGEGFLGGFHSTLCDDVIDLSVEEQADSVTVVKDAGSRELKEWLGKNGTITRAQIDPEANAVAELAWSDGKKWTQDSDQMEGLEEWDDEECRAYSGPAARDSMDYEVYFGASVSLSFKNIPGVTGDGFACVANSWLEKHRERFECILRKASETQVADEFDGYKEMRREGIRKALAKLESVMPAKGNSSSSCTPSICIGMSVVKFPIPSPVPSISLFITWPFSMSACNGMNLRDEIAEIKEAGGADVAARLDEAEGSGAELSGGGSHGMAFGVFPVPDAAYFAMGTGRLSWMSGAKRFADEKELSRILAADTTRIDKLMLNAMTECPETWNRFVAHGKMLGKDPRGSAADRQAIARAFPEFSTLKPGGQRRVGVGGGLYGQISFLGVAAGAFGGGSVQGRALGKKFRGCAPWKKVIQEWYRSPLSDLDVLRTARV